MKHIYIVRHGHTEMNEQGLFSGQTETPLTAKGREQAEAAGEQAKELGIDYVVSSPLSRAHDTAKIIARAVGYPEDKIELNDLLLERHFGSAEGAVYSRDFDLEAVEDVEKLHVLEARLAKFWQHLQTVPAENILVVTHGSSGRMLRHVILPDIPFHGTAAEHHLPNAEIIQLI